MVPVIIFAIGASMFFGAVALVHPVAALLLGGVALMYLAMKLPDSEER